MSDFKQEFTDNVLPQDKLLGIYRGIVEDNIDSKKAGRCRIRVFGVHTSNKEANYPTDGIPTEHLPWAQPCCPIYGGISKVGIYGVPCQGSHVFLFFENGHILQPRYFATAPGISGEGPSKEFGFYDPDGVYPLPRFFDDPDWNDGEGNPDKTYGCSFVIGDKAGSKIEFDSTPGKEKIIIEHGITHDKITFENDGIKRESGSIDKSHLSEQDITVGGDSKTNVMGKYTLQAVGESINISGPSSKMIAGRCDETITGQMNTKCEGLNAICQGSSETMTSDTAKYISSKEMSIKSKEGNVKIEAMMKNIDMLALVGISGNAATISFTAALQASLQGLISTSVGGGIMTTVDSKAMTLVKSSCLTKISGSMVMIGGGIVMIG